MKSLVAEFVLPELARRFPERCAGQRGSYTRVFESELNRRIKTLELSHAGVEIGYLPHDAEVRLTPGCCGKCGGGECRSGGRRTNYRGDWPGASHWEKRRNPERAVGTRLRARKWRVALAESCTGGWWPGR